MFVMGDIVTSVLRDNIITQMLKVNLIWCG